MSTKAKVFEKMLKGYTTGAVKSKNDFRNVKLSDVVSATKKLPKEHITDISAIPVLDQKNLGACVGHAFATMLSYFELKETGKLSAKGVLSPRFIYANAKAIDDLITEGTYPAVAAKVIKNSGCATVAKVPNTTSLPHDKYIDISNLDVTEAATYGVGGYAFATISQNGLKQALVANDVFCIALRVGGISPKTIKPGTDSSHYVMVYGYKDVGTDTEFYYRNSWSEHWGDKGNGKFLWSEFTAANLHDAITMIDVPNSVLIKNRWKYFKADEKTGGMGTVADLDVTIVDMLDKARDIAGIPFKITSGYRTPEYNAKIGGVKDSAHTKRLAADIAVPNGEAMYKIVNALMAAGFARIGINFEKKFVHCDIDTSKPAPTIWSY